jgi:hypothetical protein
VIFAFGQRRLHWRAHYFQAEKDRNLRVVYARIGRCQGRSAWRGA